MFHVWLSSTTTSLCDIRLFKPSHVWIGSIPARSTDSLLTILAFGKTCRKLWSSTEEMTNRLLIRNSHTLLLRTSCRFSRICFIVLTHLTSFQVPPCRVLLLCRRQQSSFCPNLRREKSISPLFSKQTCGASSQPTASCSLQEGLAKMRPLGLNSLWQFRKSTEKLQTPPTASKPWIVPLKKWWRRHCSAQALRLFLTQKAKKNSSRKNSPQKSKRWNCHTQNFSYWWNRWKRQSANMPRPISWRHCSSMFVYRKSSMNTTRGTNWFLQMKWLLRL